jgi:outer membrane protein TolC
MLAGCSHARLPVDLSPVATFDEATAEMPPLHAGVAAVPDTAALPAGTTPCRITFEEITPPPAGDAAVKLASFPGPDGAASPPLLSLSEAIQLGLQYNPSLAAALSAIERSRGQEQAAFAPFLPQIDILNRYAATSKTLLPGAPGLVGAINITGISPYQAWQSELQLQWILYDFGRTAGRYRQAGMREAIAQLQAERARQTVAYDVAAAYLQALEATAIREIAVEAIRRAEAVLEDVRARQEGGVALRDDVLRADVELSEARDALVRAEDAEITALAQLNNALGRDASMPLRLASGQYPGVFQATLAECLQRAAAQRPEVGVARDRVAAAEFGRQAAKGEFLPRLTVLGGLGRVDGEEVVSGWQEGVGIHINVPLYHGGANLGNLHAADADIAQAVADAQSIVNDISLQITLAHRGVISAQARAELARPAVEQSRETLRLVRQRYRNGTATPTDVIDAETARTRSEQRYVSARIEYLSALAKLAYAMGDRPGDLQIPLAPPEDPAPAELPMPRAVPNGDPPAAQATPPAP